MGSLHTIRLHDFRYFGHLPMKSLTPNERTERYKKKTVPKLKLAGGRNII